MSDHVKATSRMSVANAPTEDRFHGLDDPSLASDVLIGVEEITFFIRGTREDRAVRSTYHVLETSNTIPHFKWGSRTCARKSAIRAKLWMQERRSWTEAEEDFVRLHLLLSGIMRHAPTAAGAVGMSGDIELLSIVAEAVKTIERVMRSGTASTDTRGGPRLLP